jgi:hypothetical protein
MFLEQRSQVQLHLKEYRICFVLVLLMQYKIGHMDMPLQQTIMARIISKKKTNLRDYYRSFIITSCLSFRKVRRDPIEMEVRSFLKQVGAKAKQNGELHFLFVLTADVKACTMRVYYTTLKMVVGAFYKKWR